MSTSCRPSAAVVLLWLVVGAVVSVYLTRTRPTARKAAAREEQRLLWANASPAPTGGVCGGRLSSVGGSGPLLPGKAFLLLVLSHDDKSERIAKSWCQCKPWTRVVRITTTPFFESVVYRDVAALLAREAPVDYVALATYRSVQMLPLEKVHALLHLAHHGGFDVVPLMNYGFPLMEQAVRAHRDGFRVAWDGLLTALGHSVATIRRHDRAEVFLRNTFICNLAWFHRLAAFMVRAMDTATNDVAVARRLEQDAQYEAATKGVAQRVFHTPYYQYHPFVFERLPVFFFHHEGAKVFTMLPPPVETVG